jgi:hypothetical protein
LLLPPRRLATEPVRLASDDVDPLAEAAAEDHALFATPPVLPWAMIAPVERVLHAYLFPLQISVMQSLTPMHTHVPALGPRVYFRVHPTRPTLPA